MAPRLRPFQTSIPAPAQSSHRLDPTEDFLHPLADALAGLITAPARRAPVQPREVHAFLARDVRRDPPLPARGDEAVLMLAFVRSHGLHLHSRMQRGVRVDRLHGHHRF